MATSPYVPSKGNTPGTGANALSTGKPPTSGTDQAKGNYAPGPAQNQVAPTPQTQSFSQQYKPSPQHQNYTQQYAPMPHAPRGPNSGPYAPRRIPCSMCKGHHKTFNVNRLPLPLHYVNYLINK